MNKRMRKKNTCVNCIYFTQSQRFQMYGCGKGSAGVFLGSFPKEYSCKTMVLRSREYVRQIKRFSKAGLLSSTGKPKYKNAKEFFKGEIEC